MLNGEEDLLDALFDPNVSSFDPQIVTQNREKFQKLWPFLAYKEKFNFAVMAGLIKAIEYLSWLAPKSEEAIEILISVAKEQGVAEAPLAMHGKVHDFCKVDSGIPTLDALSHEFYLQPAEIQVMVLKVIINIGGYEASDLIRAMEELNNSQAKELIVQEFLYLQEKEQAMQYIDEVDDNVKKMVLDMLTADDGVPAEDVASIFSRKVSLSVHAAAIEAIIRKGNYALMESQYALLSDDLKMMYAAQCKKKAVKNAIGYPSDELILQRATNEQSEQVMVAWLTCMRENKTLHIYAKELSKHNNSYVQHFVTENYFQSLPSYTLLAECFVNEPTNVEQILKAIKKGKMAKHFLRRGARFKVGQQMQLLDMALERQDLVFTDIKRMVHKDAEMRVLNKIVELCQSKNWLDELALELVHRKREGWKIAFAMLYKHEATFILHGITWPYVLSIVQEVNRKLYFRQLVNDDKITMMEISAKEKEEVFCAQSAKEYIQVAHEKEESNQLIYICQKFNKKDQFTLVKNCLQEMRMGIKAEYFTADMVTNRIRTGSPLQMARLLLYKPGSSVHVRELLAEAKAVAISKQLYVEMSEMDVNAIEREILHAMLDFQLSNNANIKVGNEILVDVCKMIAKQGDQRLLIECYRFLEEEAVKIEYRKILMRMSIGKEEARALLNIL